jgi:hypothetical protein
MLSRRTLAAALLAVTCSGCSSSALGLPAAPDAADDAHIADTATAPDAEGNADTSDAGAGDALADTAVDAVPEAANDSAETSADAREAGAVDAAPETPVDPLVLEQQRCEAGAPRLYWMPGNGCFDSSPPAGVLVSPAPCTFARHADGTTRCMPVSRGPVVAYSSAACSPNATFVAVPSLPPGADFNLPMLGIVDEATGAHVRRGRSVKTPVSGSFYLLSLGVCSVAMGSYVGWSTPSNMTFAALEEVPASSFVATSL